MGTSNRKESIKQDIEHTKRLIDEQKKRIAWCQSQIKSTKDKNTKEANKRCIENCKSNIANLKEHLAGCREALKRM